MKVFEGRPDSCEGRLEKEIAVYDFLDNLGVKYQRVDHEALMTIAACEEVDKSLEIEICKNLFMCNRQKTDFYLLLIPGNKAVQVKEISPQVPCSRLSFASGEHMEEYLNVTPGSATVMGLLFDPEQKVQLLVDEEIFDQEYFGCHPCINTSSVKMTTKDMFEKVLPAMNREYITVKLTDGNSK